MIDSILLGSAIGTSAAISFFCVAEALDYIKRQILDASMRRKYPELNLKNFERSNWRSKVEEMKE
jgi:hypothetical protein